MASTTADTYDALIIGGGPAGLAAALGLSRQMWKAVLFDSGRYRNDYASHMHTVPGFDHRAPADFRAAVRHELTGRYKTTELVSATVTAVARLPEGGFSATTDGGVTYKGRKLVLASGVRDVFPDIEGYANCWGKGVVHCQFCHGFEERGAPRAGVLAAESPMLKQKQHAIMQAAIAKRFAAAVTIYTHGSAEYADEVRADAAAHGITVETRRVAKVALRGGPHDGVRVTLGDGSVDELGFLLHAPPTAFTNDLGAQLGLEVDAMGNYKTTNPFGESTAKGVFVAGDVATMAKAVSPALSTGGFAAAGIAHTLPLEH